MCKKWVVTAALLVCIGALAFGVPAQAQGGGPLAQLLGQVPDNQVSRTVIWYGSLSDLTSVLGFQLTSLQDLQKLTQQQQAAYLLDAGKQVYYSPFSGTEQPADWEKTFGLNTFAIAREVTIGATPNWYGVLQGKFASATVIQALTALGYTANGSVYSLGADNSNNASNAANKLAGSHYDRVIVSDTQIIAASSTALIQAATSGSPIISDAGYAAMVNALEGPSTLPGTQLLSAALYHGPYLSDTVISAVQASAPLPRYQEAGIGYRRDATNRYWVIALVYTSAADATQAKTTLAAGLPGYTSISQKGRQLFSGWTINSAVAPSPDGKFQVVTVTMQLPAQTDVALTTVTSNKDLGFLATTH